jgi:citronellyl-CoA dehydrogenase
MQLTTEHRQLADTVLRFVREELNPHVAEWEAAEQFPSHEVFKKLGELGLLGLKYDPAYGGQGLDFSYSMVMAEALGECACGGVPMAIGVQTDMCTPALARFGSDELKREFLAPAIAGDRVGCIGVSEPGAGSDVAAVKTTAKKDGGDYVINGGKMWITNGMQADWCCLLANTSAEGGPHRNKSLIMVPMDAKGHQPAEDHQDRHGCLGHRAALLRRRARAAAQRHRPGRHGLHLPDAAVPGGTPVGRGEQPAHDGQHDRPDHRLHCASARPSASPSSTTSGALQARRAATEVEALRALTTRGRGIRRRQGRDAAGLDGQAEVRAAGREVADCLPAVLGRHGLHLGQPVSRAWRDTPGVDRRRRRRGDAGHHLQAGRHLPRPMSFARYWSPTAARSPAA